MPSGILLIITVVVNYLMHLLGLQTLCQWIRAHVPRPLAAVGLAGLFTWLVPHLLLGYKPGGFWTRGTR